MKEFTQLHNMSPYSSLWGDDGHLGRIWALVDSNRDVQEPASIFRRGPFFVVQAASPRPMRRDWTKGIQSEDFYMKPWTFSEVLQV